MMTTITVEVEQRIDSFEHGVYYEAARLQLDVASDGLAYISFGEEEVKLTKRKVLETAQALNYLATTMEDEE